MPGVPAAEAAGQALTSSLLGRTVMTMMDLPEGVTYRQLNYWVKQKYFQDAGLPERDVVGLAPGTGNEVRWTVPQKRMITVMGQLYLIGMSAREAAKIAVLSRHQGHGELVTEIRPGITLTVNLDKLY